MNIKKFAGPIESIVGQSCPGRSYCEADRCFRSGGSCGDDLTKTCCLNQAGANDLVNDLGCSGGKLQSQAPRFSEGVDYNKEISTCASDLTLASTDTAFLCLGVSDTPACLQKMCDLGCKSTVCPHAPVTKINLQNQVCETIQQYCDILDPLILVDPVYNHLCCDVDLESGVVVRTVCGCPNNPCKSTSTTRNITTLKLAAANYYNDLQIKNLPQSAPASPTNQSTPPISPVSPIPQSGPLPETTSQSFILELKNNKKIIIGGLIIGLILLVSFLYYHYKHSTPQKSIDLTDSTNVTRFTDSPVKSNLDFE